MVSASVSRAAGGIFEIERRLSQELAKQTDVTVGVFGTRDEFTDQDLPQWHPLRPQTFKPVGPRAFGYSMGFGPALARWEPDLAHLHSLWMYPSMVARHWAARTNRMTLITANGMLEPWALRNSRWKKRAALWLFERTNLERAACIQVNTAAEAASVRALGLTNPLAVIPNGVDEAPQSEEPGWAEGRRVLLFLGRIHPKKGLVPLLHAWSQKLDAPEWLLAIAGWNQGEHEQELKALATKLGIPWIDKRDGSGIGSARIAFLGPQFGADKERAYRGCNAFILPSFSEGLPMAVLEAWSYRKPVLMTPGCNLTEGFAAGAALSIEPDAHSISAGLNELDALSDEELRSMGARGACLVTERFSWPHVAAQMRDVYRWLLEGAPRPDYVLA